MSIVLMLTIPHLPYVHWSPASELSINWTVAEKGRRLSLIEHVLSCLRDLQYLLTAKKETETRKLRDKNALRA